MISSREYPERPLVGVGVVLRRDGAVLLVKRARPPRAGEWSLPGGLQRLGESVREAAEREVREETGLIMRIVGIVDVVDFIERNDDGDVRYHYTLIDVAGDWLEGEACAGDDAAAVAWVRLDNLDRYQLWTETISVIRRAMSIP